MLNQVLARYDNLYSKFSLSGRASALEYWFLLVEVFIGFTICSLFANSSLIITTALAVILSFILIGRIIAFFFQRVHDFNLSAWWLVPLLLGLTYIDLELENFSPLMAKTISSIVFTFIFGILPGSTGTNRYGKKPS